MRGFAPIGLLVVIVLADIPVMAQAPIPTVHTWGDLQNAPKFSMVPFHAVDPQKTLPAPTEPVSFQVGVSSDTVAAGSAILLYFLGLTGSQDPYTPQEWGVYWLEIDGQMEGGSTLNITYHDQKGPTGPLFYAQAISFQTPGDHVLKLIKPIDPETKPAPKHEVLAQVTIHVKDVPNNRWYPLWTIQKTSCGARRGKNADGSYYAIEPVTNPKGGVAVPDPPRPGWFKSFPNSEKALPALYPAGEAGSRVQLKMDDSTLIVTFEPRIEGFFPDDYFLTRWWVNGKQVELNPKESSPGQVRLLDVYKPDSIFQRVAWRASIGIPLLTMGAQIWHTKEVHFDLDFQPEWIGAKKGDRIDVQFLYCPTGFIQPPGGSANCFLRGDEPSSSYSCTSFSELSNRIAFTYSGDLKHPQQ